MKQQFYLLSIAFFVISCNQVYKKWEKESFSTLSWKPEKEIQFHPEIKDTAQTYELILGVRHLYESRISEMNLVVTSISPSGKEQISNYTVKLKDTNGKSLASCTGNICDLETVVDRRLKFAEAGQYTITIAPNPERGRIVGIMEFGLIIEVQE